MVWAIRLAMKSTASLRLLLILCATTIFVMSTFVGIRYYLSSTLFETELEQRALAVSARVSNSVKPIIWDIYKRSNHRQFSAEISSAILDSEMEDDFITSIKVYGNFGHLYMSRSKPEVPGQHLQRISQPIKQGEMTIGNVEIHYNDSKYQELQTETLYVEVLQVTTLSFLFILSLYLALRLALVNPMKSLQIAHQAMGSMNEAIIVIDENDTILDTNNAFSKMFGYDKEEVLQQSITDKLNMVDSTDLIETIKKETQLNGHWSGETFIYRQDQSQFPAWINVSQVINKDEFICFVIVITDITEKKSAEKQLHNLAYYDSLTHLPNRALFKDKLEREITSAKRSQNSIGLLFIDLDNFKWINDSFGHGVGDKLLIKISQRFSKRIRSSDNLFRLGGDEFTIISTHVENDSSLEHLARDLIKLAEKEMVIEKHTIHVSASIGIAFFPRDASSSADLIKKADAAMYQAKDSGRGRVCFFSHELEQRRAQRRKIESSLKRALSNQEFTLYYQPKLQIKQLNNHAYGAEALLRWQKPDGSLIPPGDFIPVAEESGLILEIGNWVIESVCQQLSAWQNTPLSSLHISINLSPRQLRDNSLFETLQQAITKHGINPQQLELEITETAIIENIDASIKTITLLKTLGCSISMDDFGTGYSSLSYLSQLPVDIIKIDRSFINEIPNNRENIIIINAIFSMAESMGLSVVAEGIENTDQLKFLMHQHCKFGQGFYFSEPLPTHQFENWFNSKASA